MVAESSKIYGFLKKVMALAVMALLCLGVVPGLALAQAGSNEPVPAHARRPELKFTQLSIADGLSHADVRSIVRDQQGFMWFGTWLEGLNRYDGNTFKVYRHDARDEHSLCFDSIYVLCEDREHTLWVGTFGGGLDRYDRATDSFIHYGHRPGDTNSLPDDAIRALYEDAAGTFWVGTSGGLSRLDRSKGTFFTYRPDPDAATGPNSSAVRSICQDRRTGLLWVGGFNGGVSVFDPATGRFTHWTNNPSDNASLSDNAVNSIFQDRRGDLWLCTPHGLNRWNPETQGFIRYRFNPDQPASLGHDYVTAVYEDRAGRFWVGTADGLDLLDRSTGTFFHYRHDPNDPASLSGNYINISGLYEDDTGALWIATHDAGINRLAGEKVKFATYRNDARDPNSLNQNTVTALYGDHAGNLWVGTAEGLNRFDGRNFVHYFSDPKNPNTLSPGPVWALTEGMDHQLWVGVNGGGVCRFDGTNFVRYRHDPADPRSLGGDFLYGLQADHQGGLWISVHSSGLDYFDGRGFTHFRPENGPHSLPERYVGTVVVDQTDCAWAGSATMGLIQFDPATRQATTYLLDPERPGSKVGNWVRDICSDGKTIWVAAYSGLFSFDLAARKFTRCYTEKDGLASSSVLSVQTDARGNVWVATLAGLSKLDTRSQTFRNYDAADGLQGAPFCERSKTRLADGRLGFGGVNGFNLFDPANLPNNSVPPPVVLTDFQLFNKPVAIGKDSPLKTAIQVADQITLRYDQDVFCLKFAALDYAAPQKNRYAYKLEGFDQDWRYVDARDRSATYTTLPPGHYTFRVKAANNDGIWNEQGAAINLTITPPWWLTWWFRVGAVAVLLATLSGGYWLRVRKITRRNQELERQVAERKQAEETIRMLHADLTATLQAIPDLLLEFDRNGTCLNIWARDPALLAREKKLLLNHAVAEVLAPEVAESILSAIHESDEKGCSAGQIISLNLSDGPHWFELSTSKKTGVDGADARFVMLSRDITKLKEAQAAVLQEKVRLQFIFDALPVGICLAMKQGDGCEDRLINDAHLRIAGIRREEDTPETWQRISHPDDRESQTRLTKKLEAGEMDRFSMDKRYIWPNGEIIWVIFSILRRKLEGGQIEDLTTVVDITERKRAEAALRESEQRLQMLAEATFEGICISENGRILDVNDRFCAMCGYEHHELIGRELTSFFVPEERSHMDERIRTKDTSFAMQRAIRKDGSFFYFEVQGQFRDVEGHIVRIAALRDITERRALEQQLRQAQKLEAIGQLAGGVAHDFNNILIAITMLADLIRKAAVENQPVQETLRDLDDELNRAANLTRQLLVFGRRSVMETKVFNLNDVVGNLLKMMGRLLGEQVNLQFQPAAGLSNVRGDAGMFDQVITNLAVNARDAMPQGGVISIIIGNVEITPDEAALNSNRRPGDFVKLSVTDTGAGMDESVLKHIFEPFFTTKALGKGTGLGLATVHGIVKQHHGWVEVYSQPGQGSRFSVFLPAFTGAMQINSPAGQGGDDLRGNETILLVEDELKVRQSISLNLQMLGYTVLEAAHGPAALEKWKLNQSRVDLLLTDMVLPEGMTGTDLAGELKAQSPGLKVIIISGYVADGGMRKKLEEGNLVFLQKPFNALTLARKVRECLNNNLK